MAVTAAATCTGALFRLMAAPSTRQDLGCSFGSNVTSCYLTGLTRQVMHRAARLFLHKALSANRTKQAGTMQQPPGTNTGYHAPANGRLSATRCASRPITALSQYADACRAAWRRCIHIGLLMGDRWPDAEGMASHGCTLPPDRCSPNTLCHFHRAAENSQASVLCKSTPGPSRLAAPVADFAAPEQQRTSPGLQSMQHFGYFAFKIAICSHMPLLLALMDACSGQSPNIVSHSSAPGRMAL